MERATTILQNSGVKVEEVSFPSEVADAKTLERIQKVIIIGEAQVSFLKEYRVDKTKLAEEIRDIVENTSNISHKGRVEASDTYASMRRVINNLAETYSVILTPSAVDEAPLGLGDMGSATFNTMWTAGASVASSLHGLLLTRTGISYACHQYTSVCRSQWHAYRYTPSRPQIPRPAALEDQQGS